MKVFTPRGHLLDSWLSVASVQNNKLYDSGPQWASQKQSFKVASVLQWAHVGDYTVTWAGNLGATGRVCARAHDELLEVRVEVFLR